MEHNLKDLAKLIETAGKSGVQELSIGDISVKFSGGVPTESPAMAATYLAPEMPSDRFPSQDTHQTSISGASSDPRDIQAQMTPLTTPEDRATMLENEHLQLMLDDPEAFEEENIQRLMGTGVYAEA